MNFEDLIEGKCEVPLFGSEDHWHELGQPAHTSSHRGEDEVSLFGSEDHWCELGQPAHTSGYRGGDEESDDDSVSLLSHHGHNFLVYHHRLFCLHSTTTTTLCSGCPGAE